jgi:PAS domain S-box-containing protein
MTTSTPTIPDEPRGHARPHLPAFGGRLGLGVALALVPALAGLLAGAWLLLAGARDQAEARQAAAAQLAARQLESEIAATVASLSAIAASPLLDATVPELAPLHLHAARIAERLGAPVRVLDRSLAPLLNSAVPFGTPLFASPAAPLALDALEAGRPLAGPAPPGEPAAVLVAVPALRRGQPVAVVVGEVGPARLALALGRGADQPGLVLRALDPTGRLVAQWPERAAAAEEGLAIEEDVADWTVRVTAPPPGPVALLPPALLLLAALLALGAGFAASLLLRRRLAGIFATLADQAALATTREGLRLEAPCAEAAAVVDGFRRAGAALLAESRRHRALATAGALATWRADASGGMKDFAGWHEATGLSGQSALGNGWQEAVHPDDRARLLAEWGAALVARTPLAARFRLRRGEEEWREVVAAAAPVPDPEGGPPEWVGTLRDADSPAVPAIGLAAPRALAELRGAIDTLPVGIALLDPERRFLVVNARLAALGGLEAADHLGRTPLEVMPQGVAEPLEAGQRRVLATGRPVYDLPLAGEAAGTLRNTRHLLASLHPVLDSAGHVVSVTALVQDVTERLRVERGRQLLVRELNHRVKNTLASVMSLATQTLRATGGQPERFMADFVGRLRALSRAHDLLSDEAWEEAELAQVARAALAPWLGDPRRIRIEGPDGVALRPSQAQAVVLALHELATNAAKHGALSVPEGAVALGWTVCSEGGAEMVWQESGGPRVTPPAEGSRGFGSRLLERALPQDLGPGATVALRFEEAGLVATVRFPARSQPRIVAAAE